MRRARTGICVALAAAALTAVATPGALGASRTVTVEGWHPRVLAFSGGSLLWTEAATVRVDPARIAGSPAGGQRFDYYRAEVFRVGLDRVSRRFTGSPESAAAIRTSIAAMAPGTLSPTGDGGFVVAPESRRFAPPVVWCCDADGVEAVIESDGRADAPVTVGAAWTGSAVRFAQLSGGLQSLRTADPAGLAPATIEPTGPAAAPGLLALSREGVAWVDPADPATLRLRGAGSDPAGATSVALPGPALKVWGSPGFFAVAVRVGARVALLRVDEAAPVRAVRVWTGARVPRVALGGGSIAVADGRRVRASLSGPLRVTATGRRIVDAVGVDGRRVAWIERGTRRGARVGVVRLGRLR